MFDFEKLDLYPIIEEANVKVFKFLKFNNVDIELSKQLRRASSSALLNLAEGTGRMSGKDKSHFYTIARSSVFECVAIIRLLRKLDEIEEKLYYDLYNDFEQCSKMLLGMYRSLNK